MLIVVVGGVVLAASSRVAAQEVESGTADGEEISSALTVATKPLEPFVFVDPDAADGVRGFSVDVWNEIADRLEVTTTWQVQDTVGEIIESASTADVDVAIAGISMTPDREAIIDFTHPYYDSGLQVATIGGEDPSTFSTISDLVTSGRVIGPLIGLFGLLVVISHLIWWTERRDNEQFPVSYRKGIGEAMWWSSVSVITGGEAVKDIRRPLSRLLALSWMLVGLFLVAFVTAQAASSLTVQELQSGIASVDDLPGNDVGTVGGTVAERALEQRNLASVLFDDLDDALIALDGGSIDAVVFDAPVLSYRATTDYAGQMSVVGPIFQPDPYSIALPTGSSLREPINSALLAMLRDGTMAELERRWFG